jgi:hypothetical protein
MEAKKNSERNKKGILNELLEHEDNPWGVTVDLAQVMDVSESGVITQVHPPNPKDGLTVGACKWKAGTAGSGTMQPSLQFFNYEEVIKVCDKVDSSLCVSK